jgi:heme-degrading monooxygenase HmoA
MPRYAITAIYTLPKDTNWEALRETARQRASLYAEVPGLRAKAFVIAPERREYGGHYVFESREALETFLASELFAGSKARFGEPVITIAEVAAYLSEGAISAES